MAHSKRKEFSTLESKFFPSSLRTDFFAERARCAVKQTGSHKSRLLCKIAKNNNNKKKKKKKKKQKKKKKKKQQSNKQSIKELPTEK